MIFHSVIPSQGTFGNVWKHFLVVTLGLGELAEVLLVYSEYRLQIRTTHPVMYINFGICKSRKSNLLHYGKSLGSISHDFHPLSIKEKQSTFVFEL